MSMVKGCERRIVHLKNTGSTLFEEAFFLMKDEKNEKPPSYAAMVREATRIIEENITVGGAYRRPCAFPLQRAVILAFSLGLLLGIGATLLLMTLL